MIQNIIGYFRSLNERELFLLLLGVTFALRLYAVLMAQGIAFDSAEYGFVARDFLKNDYLKGLSSPAPPFYPWLISLFSPDTLRVEIVGRLISLFFGTFAIIPLFYLLKETIGQKEAMVSALFYSFHPYLVTYSGMLLTEAAYWGLLIPSVYFFWTGLKGEKIWRAMLSGVFLGLAYLTRPEAIGYMLLYVIWALVAGGFGKRWFKRSVFAGVLVLSILMFVFPYILYMHHETGQWLISKKAADVQSDLLSRDRDEVDPGKRFEGMRVTREGPPVLWVSRNLVTFFPSVTYHYLRAYHFSLWLFLFFGLIRARRKLIPFELFAGSLVLFHLISLSIFTPSAIRFSIPTIPLSLLWAGAGVFEIRRYLNGIKRENGEKLAFLLVVIAILSQLPQDLKPERSFRAEQRKTGEWMRQNTPPDAIIMSNSPHEAFYADREFVMLPLGISRRGIPGKSYPEIIRDVKTKGVDYILANKNTHETNPGFIESIQSSDLREIFRQPDEGLSIYEVIY